MNATEKFREMKRRGQRITALTAYDYPTARLLDESGLDIILIGDSIGMVPQSVREEGGYKVKGRTREQAEALLRDARAVEAAGAFSVVLEIVAPETAKTISQAIQIPTIGIGSGKDCDGQILVTHDLIGLFPWFTPKFVAPEANVAEQIRNAARAFVARTRGG